MKVKFLIIAVILSFAAIVPSFAAGVKSMKVEGEITGTWLGTLTVNNNSLRIIFHIKAEKDSMLSATMDSPDQGAKNIPADNVKYENGNITISFGKIGAAFDGNLSKNKNEIEGKWVQGGGSLPLTLKKVKNEKEIAAVLPVKIKLDKDLYGTWEGKLSISAIALRIDFKLVKNSDGTTSASMDSPDQGVKDIPVQEITYKNGEIILSVKSVMGKYTGKFEKDSMQINGEWQQAGRTFPLVLKKVENVKEIARPQVPKKPYPYNEEEVKVENKKAGITLAGTFTSPKKGGPFPAVVLITGSGAQNRDEKLLGHQPFLVLSDYLTRHGIAVLRMDDRGVGESGGDFKNSTTADFAGDIESAVDYLKTRKDVNHKEIGLIGHSEGGVIAPIVAVKSHSVAFIVLMAGTGVPGDRILLAQTALINKAMGEPDEVIKKDTAFASRAYKIIETTPDSAKAAEKVKKLYNEYYSGLSGEEKKNPENSPEAFAKNMGNLMSPWFRYFLSYDPAPMLEKVKCPVLALIGSNDLQVPPSQNIPAIKQALKKGGNKNFEVLELPGLNHLFQKSKTGAPSEYAAIEETINPSALKTITDWILKTVKN